MVNPLSTASDAAKLIGPGTSAAAHVGADIVTAHRLGTAVDAPALARDLIARAANDPGQARKLAGELAPHLTPVERGQLAAAIDKEATTSANGLTHEQSELTLDLTQIGIDVVGMFDPTPVTGALNTGISLGRHDWWGAGLSALSMVPYAGDLARAGKLGKYAKVVVEVAEIAAKDSKFAKEVRPALEALDAGLKKIPQTVLNMMPKGARDSIEAMKSTIGKTLGRTVEAAPAALRTGGKLDLKVAAERYAEAVKSNKPWSWADKFSGETLTAGERKAIRQEAIDRKLIPDVSLKPGTRYADFGGAGLIQKTDTLPKNLWHASDAKQFDYLDKRIPGGRPPGTTWHHSEIPGQMELVPFGPHNVINHNGGRSSGHWADAPRS